MLEDGSIDPETYAASVGEVPPLVDESPDDAFQMAAYFTEEVRRYLFERLGSEQVLRGGLIIETSLDLDLQRSAVEAVQRGLVDLDRRQGYRGPVRRVASWQIQSELEQLAEENGLLPPEQDADEPLDTVAVELAHGVAEPQASDELPEPAETAPPEAPLAELPFGESLLGVVTAVDSDQQIARVSLAPGVEGTVHLEEVAWARESDPEARPEPVKSIDRVFQQGDVARFVRIEAVASDEEPPEGDGFEEIRLALHQEPVVQGALLSVELATGDVLALVGGYSFRESQFNRVTQARRQPGSAFKPLIYGAALERGYTPADILHDRPVVYVDEASGFVWRPRNYGRSFYGPITMREALVRSVNNATVHLFRDVGVDFVIQYARRLGIESPLNRDLSLALGSSTLSLLELTRAYAVFAAAGRRVVPIFIRRVTARDGQVLLENVPLGDSPAAALEEQGGQAEEIASPIPSLEEEPDSDQLIPPEQAYLAANLLRAVVTDPKGTGWRLRALRRPVAGKTGTTNDQADAWFMGFSPDIVTGAWVGHDESHFLGKGETGSRAAAPIWVDFMRTALADRPIRDFPVPEPIVFARIDRKTGLLASATSADTVFQAFLSGTEPTETESTARTTSEGRRLLRLDSF
jgi:penicillin-binding protein 1A